MSELKDSKDSIDSNTNRTSYHSGGYRNSDGQDSKQSQNLRKRFNRKVNENKKRVRIHVRR